jgi:hypothetical protein
VIAIEPLDVDKTCASDPSHHYSSSSLFSDPFMYYSIPAVHKASLLFTDVDYYDIATSNRQADSHPAAAATATATSRPFQTLEETDADASKVSRVTKDSGVV